MKIFAFAIASLMLLANPSLADTVVVKTPDGGFIRTTNPDAEDAEKRALQACMKKHKRGCTTVHRSDSEGGYGAIVAADDGSYAIHTGASSRVVALGLAYEACIKGKDEKQTHCKRKLEWFDPNNYLAPIVETLDQRMLDRMDDLKFAADKAR